MDADRGLGAGTHESLQIDHAVLGGASVADITAGRLSIERVQAKQGQRRFPNPIEFFDDYGVEDTVRIDVLERAKPDTVCIHDIKTGRKPLSFPRMLEMVVNSQKMYGGQIRNFIVTEVRPSL